MRRSAFLLMLLLLTSALAFAGGGARHPLAVRAEEGFFAAFNHPSQEPGAKAAPLRGLLTAAVVDPADGRTWLLLGLDHLWLAAEGDKKDPLTIEHLMLSERYLSRAQELLPDDRRIPSWLVPVRLSLAGIEGKKDRQGEVMQQLLAAYAEDPTFHSFTLALLSFDNPPASPEFQRGLEALRSTRSACTPENPDPSCQDLPRWPHNREAFATFFADYELKAGHPDLAREHLLTAQRQPGYAQWPFRTETEERLKNLDTYAALYADADRGNDPPMLMASSGGLVCRSCHMGS
jgi:hypothetical protein